MLVVYRTKYTLDSFFFVRSFYFLRDFLYAPTFIVCNITIERLYENSACLIGAHTLCYSREIQKNKILKQLLIAPNLIE
jgi:hypothetical protein